MFHFPPTMFVISPFLPKREIRASAWTTDGAMRGREETAL